MVVPHLARSTLNARTVLCCLSDGRRYVQADRDALANAKSALEGDAAAQSTALSQELQTREQQLAAADAAHRELESVAAELQTAKADLQAQLAGLAQAKDECAPFAHVMRCACL